VSEMRVRVGLEPECANGVEWREVTREPAERLRADVAPALVS